MYGTLPLRYLFFMRVMKEEDAGEMIIWR
jgi:hypothetical protein